MSAQPRFLVIGGGLAGLMATIKIAERGHPVDLFSIVPGQALAFGVRAGRDQRRRQHQGRERLARDPLLRHGQGRRLPRPPAARARSMCYAAPEIIYLLDRMGVPFNRTAEGDLDFRRFGGTLHHRTAFAGRHHRPAAALRARRAGAPLRGRGAGAEVRGLGVPRAGARDARRAAAAGIVALDLRTMKIEAFPADAVILATGGLGVVFGRSTNSVICTGLRGRGGLPGGRALRQRRVHPDPPDRHPRRGQAAADVRVGARRGRPRLGAAEEGRRARPEGDPRGRALVLPRGEVPEVRKPRPARHRRARDLPRLRRPGPGRRRREPGLPRPDAQEPRVPRPAARRDPRDLREVRRRRPAHGADADLPRRPLLDGRPVGRLRDDSPTGSSTWPRRRTT